MKAKVKPHKLLSLLLALVMAVGMLPGMGMTALAVEDGDEGNGPPAVEVVESEDGNSGSDETEGTPPRPNRSPQKGTKPRRARAVGPVASTTLTPGTTLSRKAA